MKLTERALEKRIVLICRERATRGEKLKYRPFWGSPLFCKAPPRQFQPPKCKLTPSKIQIGEARFLCISIQKLQIGGLQSVFGGCQLIFWRVPIYILEAEIVLGVLYRKGVIPKKGGTLASPQPVKRKPCELGKLNLQNSSVSVPDAGERAIQSAGRLLKNATWHHPSSYRHKGTRDP